MQKKLILKVVSFYKKHPKRRRTAIAMLFLVVFFGLVFKYALKGIKKYAPRAAVATTVFLVCLIAPRSITIGSDEIVQTGQEDAVEADNDNTEVFDSVMSEIEGGDIYSVELPDVQVNILPWNLILLNSETPLPDDFSFTGKQVRSGCVVDERIYDSLMDMLSGARAAGYTVFVCSAYRSEDRQYELFDEAMDYAIKKGMSDSEAYDYAADQYSVPGTSEHQAGLAVDIVPLRQQILDAALGNTEEEKWLAAHCAEYGFILRYPDGREDITGISYEPWHYRYVGVEAAGYIMENDITLEEYLEIFYPNHVNWE